MPSIQMFESPYLVAFAKGYFAEEGLDFKYLIANGGVATPALVSGSVDASASSASALAAIMRGARRCASFWCCKTADSIRSGPRAPTFARWPISKASKSVSKRAATRARWRRASRCSKPGISPDAVGYLPLGTANAAKRDLEHLHVGLRARLNRRDAVILRISGDLVKGPPRDGLQERLRLPIDFGLAGTGQADHRSSRRPAQNAARDRQRHGLRAGLQATDDRHAALQLKPSLDRRDPESGRLRRVHQRPPAPTSRSRTTTSAGTSTCARSCSRCRATRFRRSTRSTTSPPSTPYEAKSKPAAGNPHRKDYQARAWRSSSSCRSNRRRAGARYVGQVRAVTSALKARTGSRSFSQR